MTAWGAVAASLSHLVTALTTALPAVRVFDGQPLDTPTEPDVIIVGFNPDRLAASTAVAPVGMSAETVSFDLACMAECWRGDTDPADIRADLVTLMDSVAAVIAADRTLGGAVLESRLELIDFDQQQGTGGASATVAFTVRARTFA